MNNKKRDSKYYLDIEGVIKPWDKDTITIESDKKAKLHQKVTN